MRLIGLAVILAVSLVLAPLAAHPQQASKVYRIGFLGDSPAAFSETTEAFRQGLRDLGYVEGRNITIEYRWAEGKPERMRELPGAVQACRSPARARCRQLRPRPAFTGTGLEGGRRRRPGTGASGSTRGGTQRDGV